MARPWLKPYRKNGELLVFNQATSWASAVNKALGSFNDLKLGVKLTATKEITKANIVIRLAIAADKYDHKDPWYEGTVKTKPGFDPKLFHGQCSTLSDPDKKHEIVFAGIFLPGSVKATDGQKEVVVVHEFIHACGMNGRSEDGKEDPNQDHDIEGIMFGVMKADGNGLIEYMPPKGAKAMPRIRIGGRTLCKMRELWSSADQCEK